jgi:ATP/maltotriose-dependent transcriptional regulator MalT
VLSPLERRLSRETYLDAWSSALFAGSLAGDIGMAEVSREARVALAGEGAASGPGVAERPADVLLDGFSLAFTAGRDEAVPVLSRAATAFAGDQVSVEEVLRWGWLATAAAVMAWDFDTCLVVSERGVRFAREAGALTVLAVSANVLGQALALAGDFDGVSMRVAEADAVVEATGTQVAPYGALVLAGLRGREDEAAPLIEATVREATAGSQGTAVQYAHWADALLQNGLGRYGEALTAARLASEDTPELFVSVWASVELVEAAARHDRPDLAAAALARLEGATVTKSGDWAAGLLARSRALLSEGDDADALHKEAIECLSRTRLRPDLARAHLLYGEWLRRAGRRVDARAQLRAAHDQLAGIGMEAFAERARSELRATGENVRRRTVETSDDLTPQELQIARLARDGLSNPEIGERLFLSPRTVEWHLRKVFAKLEIRSRRELARALPVSDPQLVVS